MGTYAEIESGFYKDSLSFVANDIRLGGTHIIIQNTTAELGFGVDRLSAALAVYLAEMTQV